jgi:hypothetical protein
MSMNYYVAEGMIEVAYFLTLAEAQVYCVEHASRSLRIFEAGSNRLLASFL